jgi:methyl-accepting chemotaxis protein
VANQRQGSWLRFITDSIRVKILAPVVVILVALFVTLSIYSTWFASDEAQINLETKARGESRLAAYALSKPLAYKDLEQIKPILDGITSDPDVRAVAVYDADGVFVAGNRQDRSRVALDDLLKAPLREADGHLLVAHEVLDQDQDQQTGQEMVVRVGALWIDFSSERTEERVLASWVRYTLIAGIGVLVTTLLLAWVLTRLLAPIHDLTRVAGQIVRGDLTQAVRVTSTDEIGQLASAFGQMLEKLREIPLRLHETTQLLTVSVDSLSRSTAAQSDTVTRQAAAVQETQVTVQEIKQTSQLAAQKAEAVLKVAERADEISRSGEVAISQSLGGLADIRSQVEEIAQKIGRLQERTRQIGLITETVKDLADKSNMLALNAAIEAVRSGEHGKGFAVVAREIRNLADQSIQATNRVREILEDLGNAIRTAVSITEKGAQKMESGLVQMTMSGESLRELSSIVKDNAAAVRQIAAAVSQQDAGITQIFGAVSDLNQMMDDTIARLEHTGQAVDTLRGVSTQVSTVVGSFRV